MKRFKILLSIMALVITLSGTIIKNDFLIGLGLVIILFRLWLEIPF